MASASRQFFYQTGATAFYENSGDFYCKNANEFALIAPVWQASGMNSGIYRLIQFRSHSEMANRTGPAGKLFMEPVEKGRPR
jgi:hypothetical protein